MKILVVDDEPLFLEFTETCLKSLGFRDTVTADSGLSALDEIAEAVEQFDCFLLDIQMPGMDGIELCKKIRAIAKYTTTPIVMITSMTEKSYVDRAFLAGANDYVTKPINRTEISARMGMVETIVAERKNSLQLLDQVNAPAAEAYSHYRFEDPILLEDADFLLPLTSLENYLLRLGSLRMFSSAAIGFHVENAATIFACTDGLEFADVMTEVAIVIRDCATDRRALMTYAGGGNFCAVQSRTKVSDALQFEMTINDLVSRRLEVVVGNDIGLPIVRVGRAYSNGLISISDPTRIVYQAIEDAARTPSSLTNSKKWRAEGLQHGQ